MYVCVCVRNYVHVKHNGKLKVNSINYHRGKPKSNVCKCLHVSVLLGNDMRQVKYEKTYKEKL